MTSLDVINKTAPVIYRSQSLTPANNEAGARFCSGRIIDSCKSGIFSVFTANLGRNLRDLKNMSGQVYKDTLDQIKDTGLFKNLPNYRQLLNDSGTAPAFDGYEVENHPRRTYQPVNDFHQPQPQHQAQQVRSGHQSLSPRYGCQTQQRRKQETHNYPVWPQDKDQVIATFNKQLCCHCIKPDDADFPAVLFNAVTLVCSGVDEAFEATQPSTIANALRWLKDENDYYFRETLAVVRNSPQYQALCGEFDNPPAASNPAFSFNAAAGRTPLAEKFHSMQTGSCHDTASNQAANAYTAAYSSEHGGSKPYAVRRPYTAENSPLAKPPAPKPRTQFFTSLSGTGSIESRRQPRPATTLIATVNRAPLKPLSELTAADLYDDDEQEPVDMPTQNLAGGSAAYNQVLEPQRFDSLLPGTVYVTPLDLISGQHKPASSIGFDIENREKRFIPVCCRLKPGKPLKVYLKTSTGGSHEFKINEEVISTGSLCLQMLKFVKDMEGRHLPIGTTKIAVNGELLTQPQHLKYLVGSGRFKFVYCGTVHVFSKDKFSPAEAEQVIAQFAKGVAGGSAGKMTARRLLPEKYNSMKKIEDKVYQLDEQTRSGVYNVGIADYLEFYTAIKKAVIDLRKHPITGAQGEFISEYLNLILAYTKLNRPAFAGRQNKYLDPYIALLADRGGERHKGMTVDALITEFTSSSAVGDKASAESCLLMLLQGLKYNLLTENQAVRLMNHSAIPESLYHGIKKQIREGKFFIPYSDGPNGQLNVQPQEQAESSDEEYELDISDELLHSTYTSDSALDSLQQLRSK